MSRDHVVFIALYAAIALWAAFMARRDYQRGETFDASFGSVTVAGCLAVIAWLVMDARS